MMTFEEYKEKLIDAVLADLTFEPEHDIKRLTEKLNAADEGIKRCYDSDIRELGKPDYKRHVFGIVQSYLIAG